MKNILIIVIFIFITSGNAVSDEKKCQGLKKLSKSFIECNAKNLKEGAANKTKSLKKNVKKFGSKIVNQFKKKD